ncbi:cytochrome b562 [Mannheimia varigena]|uniref:cytochrome b562 n=1 Tax=Mannheimia varigena TaxID=85404 RepID=UPI00046D22F3|nr:cytochrome b562 [Mannheimia varigena]
MKLKLILLATSLLAFSALSQAQSIKMEMMQMNMNANKLMRAGSAEDFQAIAKDFIEITEKTKAILPNSVEGDKAAAEDYQAGMQKLIDVVKKADEKAKAGELQEAKMMVSELEMIKREYHKKYK